MEITKKSLGQHWLQDKSTLEAIVDAAELKLGETVLEIGPGTGTLTEVLLSKDVKVVAVEKDGALARKLSNKINNRQFYLKEGDILQFDLSQLPPGYKVVANIPYYLTSNLIRLLSEASNPPNLMVLLVQKEVAQRLAAKPGQMSLLSVSAQLYHEVNLGREIPAQLFVPPPKVNSQVVILHRRPKPLFTGWHPVNKGRSEFFKVVKAGFSLRRKKLRSSLAGGLGISKDQAGDLLKIANLEPNARAQELSLEDWHQLYMAFVALQPPHKYLIC